MNLAPPQTNAIPVPTPAVDLTGITLAEHQQQIHDFIVTRPFAGAWLGVGSGKTLTTLKALQTLRPVGHILVVAPVAIARSTWINEIEKWGFPIRTRSLIVDEQDKKLSKDARIQRNRAVFDDPPTMYFVNQELLTQTSHHRRVITPAADAVAGGLSLGAEEMLDLVRVSNPISREDLISEYCKSVAAAARPTVTKAAATALLRDLLHAELVHDKSQPCPDCHGHGCPQCRFGLVDQMPVKNVDGHPTIIWPFQTVIIDESQAFKSHASARFKALKKVRPAITRMIQLTGTPSPNGLEDLWSQIYLLDQGASLGPNITSFRRRWFIPQMVPGTTTPAKWIPTVDAEREIHDSIRHLVMSAQNTTLHLPEVTIEDATVVLPGDVQEDYKELRRELVLDVINQAVTQRATQTYETWLSSSTDVEAQRIRDRLAAEIDTEQRAVLAQRIRLSRLSEFVTDPDENLVHEVVAENQAVLTSKLMQFASGTLYTTDPDDPSTSGRYEVIHTEKLAMVKYLVHNNGGSPVLLAYHFRSDQEQLVKYLTNAGIHVETFDGSRAMLQRWNSGSIPVMLLHPASAGHGLNFQDGGHTLIWYTLPFSLEHYIQTNGRLHRVGQQQPVTIHRLITKSTQDERMPSLLAAKQRTEDNLIHAVDAANPTRVALEQEIRDDLTQLLTAA